MNGKRKRRESEIDYLLRTQPERLGLRSLKVYGSSLGMKRRIVAARSRAEAMRVARVPRSQFDAYWCETGNPQELTIANTKPGTVFAKNQRFHDDPYVEEPD